MSEADQFREYAQEALQWATQSTIEKEKRALLELARTWWHDQRGADGGAAEAEEPAPMT
jgi:hypothetical protein